MNYTVEMIIRDEETGEVVSRDDSVYSQDHDNLAGILYRLLRHFETRRLKELSQE